MVCTPHLSLVSSTFSSSVQLWSGLRCKSLSFGTGAVVIFEYSVMPEVYSCTLMSMVMCAGLEMLSYLLNLHASLQIWN